MIDQKLIKNGLSQGEVERLALKGGLNQIVRRKRDTDGELLMRQFTSPLVLVLLGAVGLTLIIKDWSDAVLIGVAVLINVVLGFVQERKAVKSLEALRSLISVRAWVIRDGKKKMIDAKELVVGDVVMLSEGERVPADGVLVETIDLMVNEAILTGESLPVSKNVIQKDEPDNESSVFMGTLISGGLGKMIVSNIGGNTEMGSIAGSLEEDEVKTPLEKRIGVLAMYISIAVVVVALVVFVWGWMSGLEWKVMFTVAVALVVSAAPEGLVIALTVILAVGAQRMFKRKALVRKLVAAETLGSVTHVCVDKTGTLTEGKMSVCDVDFVNVALGYRLALLANDMRDATEVARVEWARQFFKATVMDKFKLNLTEPELLINESKRDDSIAFSTEKRLLAVRYKNEVMVVGAPDLLLSMSFLNKNNVHEWEQKLSILAQEGKRVLGFLHKKFNKIKDAQAVMEGLRKDEKVILDWVGLMAFRDPVRKGVREALSIARLAGVKVMVITGDYRETALAVMKSMGLHPKDREVLEGWEIEKMSEAELGRKVTSTMLFARTRPAQKLMIVKALQKKGAVVGMMGDGVNDAPALAAADIGMVVGEATDLAKDAADIVLLDSNFATIVAAIEEGRGIYDNIRKVIIFLLGMAFSEVLVILGSLIFGWSLALSAIQILWINLVTDGLPYMALTIDPKDKNVLKRKPIDSKLPLLDVRMFVMIGVMSFLTGGLSLFTYWWWLPLGIDLARTGVFLIISLGTLMYVFACRSLEEPIWIEKPWGNWYLVFSVIIGLVLTYASIWFGPLKDLLMTFDLSWSQWFWVWMCALIVLFVAEAIKILLNMIRGAAGRKN